MKKLNNINVFEFAKFQGFLMTLVGLFVGVIYSFGGFIVDTLESLQWINTNETTGLSYGTLLAFRALIKMSILFGISEFLLGVFRSLFNLCVKRFINFKVNNRWTP